MPDTTLLKKFHVRPDTALAVFDAPEPIARRLNIGPVSPNPDVVIAFVPDQQALKPALDRALPFYHRGGGLWFAYPKRSGRIESDLTRDCGWDAVTAFDLLPVSQIAIDSDWSALRFRYRDEIAKLTRKQDLPGLTQ